jgi:hypothetical protein
MTPKPSNWVFFTGTYGVSATLLGKIFDTLNATIYPFDLPSGIIWSVAFEPLPTLVTQFGDKKGGNSLGTEPKDGNAFSKCRKVPIYLFSAPNTMMRPF